MTLCYLLFTLEIQINITKSFCEVFWLRFGSKIVINSFNNLFISWLSFFKPLGIIFFDLITMVLPESQILAFLVKQALPVLLDVLFKYLIFRHLNRSSPATVATYHAMIE
jgi:hypothetical protein